MKATFRSGSPDPYGYARYVTIENIVGHTDGQLQVQGIQLEIEDAKSIQLWWNHDTRRWSLGFETDQGREVVELKEGL